MRIDSQTIMQNKLQWKCMPRKKYQENNKNEIQILNNSENEMLIENNNCMNVDMETPITEQTCQNDTKVSEYNFYFPNDVLDNLEGLV